MPFDQTLNKLTPIKVLVVDDNEAQRWVTVSWLEEQGDIICTQAADGPEGLEKAWADEPDIILLDAILPGMGGMEVLRRYKAADGPAEVILLSPKHSQQIYDLALSCGAAHFFSSPYNLPEVLPFIRAFGAGSDRKFEIMLLEMKGDPKKKGFRQAARCATLLCRNRDELMKVIYLEAAKELGERPDRLDVNIRRVIDDMHHAKTPLYRQIVPFPDAKDPPSNKEFLLLLIGAATIPL